MRHQTETPITRPPSRGLHRTPPPADSGRYAIHGASIDGRELTRERDDLRWRRAIVLEVLRRAGQSRRHTLGHVAVYLSGESPEVVASIELRHVFPGSGSRVRLAQVLSLVEAGLVDGRVPFAMNTARAAR